jgi:hypothetical protein
MRSKEPALEACEALDQREGGGILATPRDTSSGITPSERSENGGALENAAMAKSNRCSQQIFWSINPGKKHE